ncbi:MAG TPA: zinc ribbon domain-containing protein [Candidatus Angelobacter sp.]|nr:zinc ribbon domain-containing protein [Candidatus Angelobacter sp.]
MPLYEYQCKKCKHKFEKIQKFSDRPVKKCPECGSPVEKIMHAPAVQFKGSGWYVTDYGGKQTTDTPKSEDSSEKPDKSDKSEKKDTSSKEDGAKSKEKDSTPKKTETKSETKSEAKTAKSPRTKR